MKQCRNRQTQIPILRSVQNSKPRRRQPSVHIVLKNRIASPDGTHFAVVGPVIKHSPHSTRRPEKSSRRVNDKNKKPAHQWFVLYPDGHHTSEDHNLHCYLSLRLSHENCSCSWRPVKSNPLVTIKNRNIVGGSVTRVRRIDIQHIEHILRITWAPAALEEYPLM